MWLNMGDVLGVTMAIVKKADGVFTNSRNICDLRDVWNPCAVFFVINCRLMILRKKKIAERQ
jgi:hypothetical protein